MSLPIPACLLRAMYGVRAMLQPQCAREWPGQPDITVFQGRAAVAKETPPVIPQRIWSYWHSGVPDAVVRQCMDNWHVQCPGWELHILSADTLAPHVLPEHFPEGFATLHPTKQSDWLRLYLVRHYGGYWLDATTLLTCSLDWLETARQTHGAEFVGFFIESFTHAADFPVVESWAFGAAAHAPFVVAWQEEFHHALLVQGTDAYLHSLGQEEGEPPAAQLLQGIHDPQYLLIHVTAQRVLRRSNAFRLALFKAEDTAYFYHHAVGWKWFWLYPRLCLTVARGRAAPLIKLRGGERRRFAQLLAQHRRAMPGSIWHRACTTPERGK